VSQRKVLHVMEYSGRQTYIEINEAAWKKLTADTTVVDGMASGWFVDRDMLSRMLVGTSEYPHFEMIGGWPRPQRVDYYVVFSNTDKPKQATPWENFK
jgi:hypothetical protein